MVGKSKGDNSDLAGGVAIVTGGGRGLGRASALAFRAGASVMLAARSVGEIEETASLIRAEGGRAAACQTDVTSIPDLEKLIAATQAELGAPTLLMNNAGGGVKGASGPFETLAPEAILAGLQVNMVAGMILTRLVLPGMLERGRGRIINVASGAAMLAMPYMAPYCVGKTGLVRFSELLALETLNRGVSVFSMTPGNVATRLTEGLYPAREHLIAEPPASFPWVFPPGHELDDRGWYPPERGAALACFLASGKADALSGRFFSVHYDEAELVANADTIRNNQLYTLRIATLQGIEPELFYGPEGRAYAATLTSSK